MATTKRELIPYQVAQIKKLLKEARNIPGNLGAVTVETIETIMLVLKLDPHEDER